MLKYLWRVSMCVYQYSLILAIIQSDIPQQPSDEIGNKANDWKRNCTMVISAPASVICTVRSAHRPNYIFTNNLFNRRAIRFKEWITWLFRFPILFRLPMCKLFDSNAKRNGDRLFAMFHSAYRCGKMVKSFGNCLTINLFSRHVREKENISVRTHENISITSFLQ